MSFIIYTSLGFFTWWQLKNFQRRESALCKHFSPLCLHRVNYCSVGQKKSHDQAQNQCGKGLPKGRLG